MSGIVPTAEEGIAEGLDFPLLSPAEQRILPPLLAGDTEREIASQFDKSPATVNKQVGSIYRAYGVDSKPKLMARHHEIADRKKVAKNGPDGVNTPLQPPAPIPHNPPVARKRRRKVKK